MDDKRIIERLDAIDQRLSKIESRVFKEAPPQQHEVKQKAVKIIEKTEETFVKTKELYKPIDFKALELKIGTYLFQIIGVAIFLLGMGFLFKYSIDKGWLGQEVRVAVGFATAAVFIIGGEILKKRQWSLGFISGGVALLYVSLYAGCSLYSVIPLTYAFIVAAAITLLAFALSVLHDSQLICYFSLLGGFISPLFAGKVSFYFDVFRYFNPEHVFFVISYLGLISFAFVLIALIKRWYAIAYGALMFLFLYLYTPMIDGLSFNNQVLTTKFVYWFFILLPYVYLLFVPLKKRVLEPILIIIGSACSFYFSYFYITGALGSEKMSNAYASLQWFFADTTPRQVAKILLLIFGLLYLVKTIILFIKNRSEKQTLAVLSFLTLLSFFMVIFLHFDGFTLSIILQNYVLVALGAGFIVRNVYVWIMPLLLFAISFGVYLFNFSSTMVFDSLIYNDLNLATAVLVLLLSVGSYVAYRYKDKLSEKQQFLPVVLELGIYATIFSWLLSPLWKFPYYLAAVTVYAVLLYAFSLYRKKMYTRIVSYITLLFAILRFAYTRDFLWHAHGRFYSYFNDYYDFNLICGTFIIIFVAYILLSQKYKTSLKKWEFPHLTQLYELLLAVAIFLMGSRNILIFTKELWFGPMTLSVYYGFAGLTLIFVGLLLKKHLIRFFGLYVSALTLWKLWFVILGMRETGSRVIAFIVIGLVFMIASFVYQKLSKKIS